MFYRYKDESPGTKVSKSQYNNLKATDFKVTKKEKNATRNEYIKTPKMPRNKKVKLVRAQWTQ